MTPNPFYSLKISLLGMAAFLALGTGNTLFGQSPVVKFDVTVSTGGFNYRNFKAGGAATRAQGVVGFNVDITEVNGALVIAPPIAAFCIEIAEPIAAGNYTFNASYLNQASAGRAGEVGTASLGIPTGGIGDLRAARVRYLFDNFYQSSTLTSWNQTEQDPRVHAFQLALWEASHDDDLSLSSNTGSVYIGVQDGNAATIPLRNNAISLAGTWLTNLAGAGVTDSYQSSVYDVLPSRARQVARVEPVSKTWS